MNSRQKGASGERELAGILRAYGFQDARRGQQYSGANGDADVVGLPGIHIECKRVERLNIYDAIDQSKRDAKEGETPVVMHRKNNSEWLVTMTLEEWVDAYKESLTDEFTKLAEQKKLLEKEIEYLHRANWKLEKRIDDLL